MSWYNYIADTTNSLKKYSSAFVTTLALLGFSGYLGEQHAIAQESGSTSQTKRIPKDINEELGLLEKVQENLVQSQKLRDGPEGRTRASLERQISLLTDALLLKESVQPTYVKERWEHIKGLRWQRGNALSELGKYQEAIADYDTHLLLNAEYCTGSVLNSRGNAKNDAGDFKGALVDYMLAAGADKKWDGSLYNRANLLLRLGRLEEALHDCDFALNRKPDDVPDLILKSKILLKMDHAEQALSIAEDAIKIDEKNAKAYKLAGLAHHRSILPKLTFERTIKRILDSVDKEGLNKFEKIKRLNELQLTFSEIRSRHLGGAIDSFYKAIELAPNDYEAYGYRALTLFEMGEFKLAKKDFAKANELLKEKVNLGNIRAVQDTENFNVLEYAVWDPVQQKLILLGRNDPEYRTRTIPYSDLLQTAWQHPDPRFSLDITPETREKTKELFSRKKMTSDEKGRLEQVIEEQGKSLLSILAAYLPDEKGGVRIPLSYYSISEVFWEISTVFDVESELETILAGKGTPEIHNRAFEKICGLPDFYKRAHDARAKGNADEREKLSSMFKKSVDEHLESKEMFLGPTIISDTFNFIPKARLRYVNISNDNQLARVLFEADYALKSIVARPLKIADHKTHLQWLDSQRALGNMSTKWARFWISPQNINIESSDDGNTLHFKDARLQIEAMV